MFLRFALLAFSVTVSFEIVFGIGFEASRLLQTPGPKARGQVRRIRVRKPYTDSDTSDSDSTGSSFSNPKKHAAKSTDKDAGNSKVAKAQGNRESDQRSNSPGSSSVWKGNPASNSPGSSSVRGQGPSRSENFLERRLHTGRRPKHIDCQSENSDDSDDVGLDDSNLTDLEELDEQSRVSENQNPRLNRHQRNSEKRRRGTPARGKKLFLNTRKNETDSLVDDEWEKLKREMSSSSSGSGDGRKGSIRQSGKVKSLELRRSISQDSLSSCGSLSSGTSVSSASSCGSGESSRCYECPVQHERSCDYEAVQSYLSTDSIRMRMEESIRKRKKLRRETRESKANLLYQLMSNKDSYGITVREIETAIDHMVVSKQKCDRLTRLLITNAEFAESEILSWIFVKRKEEKNNVRLVKFTEGFQNSNGTIDYYHYDAAIDVDGPYGLGGAVRGSTAGQFMTSLTILKRAEIIARRKKNNQVHKPFRFIAKVVNSNDNVLSL